MSTLPTGSNRAKPPAFSLPRLRKQRTDMEVEEELKALLKRELNTSLKQLLADQAAQGQSSPQSSPFAPVYGRPDTLTAPRGMGNERQMQINVDQMVAEALMHGKLTTGILRSLFGLVPSLIGR